MKFSPIATFPGKCGICNQLIRRGDEQKYHQGKRAHKACEPIRRAPTGQMFQQDASERQRRSQAFWAEVYRKAGRTN